MDFIPRPLRFLFETPAFLILWVVYGISDSLLVYFAEGGKEYYPLIAVVAYALLAWQAWQRRSVGNWMALALMMYTGVTSANSAVTAFNAATPNLPLAIAKLVMGFYFILGGMHLYKTRPGQDD